MVWWICCFDEGNKHICNCGLGILVNFGVLVFVCVVFEPPHPLYVPLRKLLVPYVLVTSGFATGKFRY